MCRGRAEVSGAGDAPHPCWEGDTAVLVRELLGRAKLIEGGGEVGG